MMKPLKCISCQGANLLDFIVIDVLPRLVPLIFLTFRSAVQLKYPNQIEISNSDKLSR